MEGGLTKAVYLVGIQINLVDIQNMDQIEPVTANMEKNVMEIIPKAIKEHIFIEIEKSR